MVYIGLGTLARKRGCTRGVRLASFLAALAVYGWIIAIARLHHPLGPLAALAQ